MRSRRTTIRLARSTSRRTSSPRTPTSTTSTRGGIRGAEAAVQAAKTKGLAGKIGIAGFGGNCLNLADVIKGNIQHETVFFPQSMGAQMVQAAIASTQGKKLPKITPAPILGVTTDYARALLSGKVKPPANLAILQKLRDAKSGNCPK